MARQYSREELLVLKDSPLVVKPSSLPPAEEWMGSPLDVLDSRNQQRGGRGINRAKTEDGFTIDTNGNRRPGFDPRRKSTTAPEDIILGPPKTSFPSATGRNAQRATSGAQTEDRPEKHRNNFRDRFSRDGQKDERDDVQGRDTKSAYNRRTKDDVDPWTNARQAKSAGLEEKDKYSRKNGDWEEGREREPREKGFENHRVGFQKGNGDHPKPDRRNGHWRSQDGPLWAQDTSPQDGEIQSIQNHQSKDSRDRAGPGFRAQGRSWGRGAQLDDDPLWMDAAEPEEEKKHAPTQADFEEFRAKMKAQNAKKPDTPTPDLEQGGQPDSSASRTANTAPKGKIDKALDFGDFSDKFYDILSQPKKEPPRNNPLAEESRQQVMDAAVKMAKSSKFSSLFNADSTAKNAILTQPPKDASSEDRVGFQRILKLLDQQQQPTSGEKTPPRPATRQDSQASPPMQSPLFGQREGFGSPPNPMPKTKDTEFLLNLMRQPQQGRPDQAQPRQGINIRREQENLPAATPFSNLAMSPPQDAAPSMLPPGPPPGYFEEAPRQEMPRQDKLNPNGPPLHRGAPPGLHDLFSGPQRPSGIPPGIPPGLQRRPPGFDHIPPDYNPHSQQQRAMPPPPGFPPPQRALSGGIGPGMFGSRPNGAGMPPPPGYVNMGGPPPPGFAGMGGFGHDGPGFAGGFDFGQGFPPPGQQRR